MRRRALLAFAATLLLAACLSAEPQPAEVTAPPYETPTPTVTPSEEESTLEPLSEESICTPARIIRVIDGDTLDVVFEDGTSERVRLVGVDTPETKAPEEPEEYGVPNTPEGRECLRRWGYEAYQYVLNLQGMEVCLVPTGRGYYRRLLAYVYTSPDDTTPLGYELVENGLARVYTEADFVFEEEYLQAERFAKSNKLGLWSCTSLQDEESETAAQGECDPSYPDVCIPPPPPDLDCRDVPYRNFRVLPPDPHRFDRDRDGVGCES
jgi:micrococcal nuclease